MIPGDRLTDVDNRDVFAYRVRDPGEPLTDYERGGEALSDSSQGLDVQLWTLRYENDQAIISGESVPDTVLFTRPGITQIALAFDTNMAPFVAFEDGGGVAYWWFDPQESEHVFAPYLPAGVSHPRCTLDDIRYLTDSTRDIILAYLRGGDLYYRQQRDNYAVERLLSDDGPYTALIAVGMNRKMCLQFQAVKAE